MTENTSILIVDDVPENLRLLSAMLEQTGHRVRPAISARLALMAARLEPPSLILLDIRMPEMDGLEMCRQLKADEALREIPVIFISALNDTEDKIRAFEAGGLDYITKPFQEREVLARVRTHLLLNNQKRRLAENLQQMEQLEEQRDSLAHMIVHDLRSPLVTMDGYLQMVEMFDGANLSGQGKDYLKECRRNAERIKRMIADILMVSSFEAGKIKLTRSVFDLAALARSVVEGTVAIRGGRVLGLRVGQEPLMVEADSAVICRVFENLIGNALKFCHASVEVVLVQHPNSDFIRVEITDDGPGIAPENHRKIFEKFGRIESPQAVSGTGLGLAFCRLAMEAHNGNIGVSSNLGAGSIFWFEIKSKAG
jgi:two-component system, sensor histidine kinase and response regulator